MRKQTSPSRWQGIFKALGFGRRETHDKMQSLKSHSLRHEPLEDRHLLSVLCWDPQQSGGTSLGGSGTWTNGGNTALWYNPDTHADVAWNNANGDTAVFQGANGTVTVDAAITASGIGFETAGYSLSGGTITLVQNTNSGWLDGEIRTDAGAETIGSVLAGTGGMNKTGTGTLTLTGANTYSGATAVQDGTLALAGGDNRLPTGTKVTLGSGDSSGVLQLGNGSTSSNQSLAGLFTDGEGDNTNRVVGGGATTATLALTVDYLDDVDIYGGTLGGPGNYQNRLALEMDGGGALGLTGDNTYAGGTYLNGGATGTLGSNSAFGTDPIYLNGATFGGSGTVGNSIVVEDDSTIVSLSTLRLDGNISNISGSPTLTLNNDRGVDAVLQLGGDNSGFTGTFSQWVIHSYWGYGSLTTELLLPSAGSSYAAWEIGSGVLANAIDGEAAPTIALGSLSGNNGTLTNMVAGSTVTFEIGGNNQSTDFDGVIVDGSGVTALTKIGTGTLTLGNVNTYTGVTTINDGTLQIDHASPGMNVLNNNTDGVNLTNGFLVLDYNDGSDPGAWLQDYFHNRTDFHTGQIHDTDATSCLALGHEDNQDTQQCTITAYHQVDGLAPPDGVYSFSDSDNNSFSDHPDDRSYDDNLILAGTFHWQSSGSFTDGSSGSGYVDRLRNSILAMVDALGAVNYVLYDQDMSHLEGSTVMIPLGSDPFTSSVSRETVGYGINDDGGDKAVFTGFYDVNGFPIYVPGFWGNQDGLLYWDPNHTGAAGQLGGSGTWTDGGSADWYSPKEHWYNPEQSGDVAWDSSRGDTAIFQGTPGAINVGADIGAGSIRFRSSGYDLNGDDPIALTDSNSCNSGVNTSNCTAGQIDVSRNYTDTIACGLGGFWGLIKTGFGTLVLKGASNYTEKNITIQNGTLALVGENPLPTGTNVRLGDVTGNCGVLQLGDGTAVCDQSLAGLSITDSWAFARDNVPQENRVVGGTAAVSTLTLTVDGSDEYDGLLGGPGTNPDYLALTINGSGTVILAGDSTYVGVTTISDGTLQINGATPTMNVLTNAGGVDIQSGTLVLDYSGGSDPAATVLARLTAAYNGGVNSFQSGQIRNTSATSSVGLGWADNTDTHQLAIRAAIYGDANLDGVVDSADHDIVVAHLNLSGTWADGDFNYDGVINSLDLSFV